MRFLRLRLSNYRGVENREVEFKSDGLTVIEGPNEAGKTSLAEAIRILFEHYDSSKKGEVQAIQPVDRDVGTEIEIEVQSGTCRFIYKKRFHKKPETTLRIIRPKPENLIGREAHDRALLILNESIDVALWKALQIEQTTAIGLPELAGKTALSAALDKAAGGQSADPRAESLFERVAEEYGHYFIARGAEKKGLVDVKTLADQAKRGVVELEGRLRELEGDIDRVAGLDQELRRSEESEEALQKSLGKQETEVAVIQTLESKVDAARVKYESGKRESDEASRSCLARNQLIAEETNAAKALSELKEGMSDAQAVFKTSEKEQDDATRRESELEKQRTDAEGLVKLRRADWDYYRFMLDLEQFRERKARIDAARQCASAAEAKTAKIRVNDMRLAAIEQTGRALDAARATLETQRPSMKLHALAALKVELDSKGVALGKGDTKVVPVTELTKLTIPGIIEIEVQPGASAAQLFEKLNEALRAHEAACREGGVADRQEARSALDQLREAQRTILEASRSEKADLRDLTYDDLAKKIEVIGKRQPEYRTARQAEPAISKDLDSAKKDLQTAETAYGEIQNRWEKARNALHTARAVHEGRKKGYDDNLVALAVKSKELQLVSDRLGSARTTASDDTLARTLKLAETALQGLMNGLSELEGRLKATQPGRAKELLANLKGSLQTARTKRENIGKDLAATKARLSLLGEEGIHEKLEAARVKFERIIQELSAVTRRAAAARLLYETMRDARERARQAYVTPLKDRIDKLGRAVFGETFQVDVADDLTIASRTIEGRTVPFASLSGGTQEQLCLMTRLACAMLVSGSGGGPLILDDALGHTDPGRLEGMGLLLGRGAKECQIIILTCVPERYSHVGDALIVRLSGANGAESPLSAGQRS